MKKINGIDLIEALGDVDARLLEYPSTASYKAKRLGIFSAAAMLAIALSAVIVFYARVVLVGGSSPELNGGSNMPTIGGDSMNDVADGGSGGSGGITEDIMSAEDEIKISASGTLINFASESGIINKREDGSITVTVVIGESGFIPEACIPYSDSDTALEILAPVIKNGAAIFTIDSATESIKIHSEGFPYTVELIFSDSEDFVTFIYKTK